MQYSAQSQWFKSWPFLHYDEGQDVFCHTCVKAISLDRIKFSNNISDAFVRREREEREERWEREREREIAYEKSLGLYNMLRSQGVSLTGKMPLLVSRSTSRVKPIVRQLKLL